MPGPQESPNGPPRGRVARPSPDDDNAANLAGGRRRASAKAEFLEQTDHVQAEMLIEAADGGGDPTAPEDEGRD